MRAKVKARQKAVSALETQVAELTQQLYESDQSRLQLEQQLEVQCSSNAADAAAAKVDCQFFSCMLACQQFVVLLLQHVLFDSGVCVCVFMVA